MAEKSEIELPNIIRFDWDKGNLSKSKLKHKVEPLESEQVFQNNPIYLYDSSHSQKEDRYFAYGATDQGRMLTVVFVLRNDKIRIISARDQSKKERRFYEKAKADTQI